MQDPRPILYCSYETTIMNLYNVDLLDIFGLTDVINMTVSGGVQAFAEQMSQQTGVADSLLHLNELKSELDAMLVLLGLHAEVINETLSVVVNVTSQVSDLTQYGYNSTAHNETMTAINTVTLAYNLFYDIYNVSSLNVSGLFFHESS